MINWINFLHFYQPGNIEDGVIREAYDQSYKRIIDALENNHEAKLTINISGCLIVRLAEMGYSDFLEKVKRLAKNGQLEIVASAAYHGFLPLLPDSEIKRQIEYSQIIIDRYFGPDCQIKGFYFPEMAYSTRAAKVVKEMGYEWSILDDFSLNGKTVRSKDNIEEVVSDENGLKIIFRSRRFSRSYVPQTILDLCNKKRYNNINIITATDAEIYGLRHIDPEKYFEASLAEPKIGMQTISEYIEENSIKRSVPIQASTWDTEEKELKNNLPYSVWKNPRNKVQEKIWDLVEYSIRLIDKNTDNENFTAAYQHLALGIASCTFWWASANDFKKVFGPIAWNPDLIDRNLSEIVRSVRSLTKTVSADEKIKAEKMYCEAKYLLWKKHWAKYS